MIDLLMRDIEDAPHRFYLYGAVDRQRLHAWWSRMPWYAPDDLLAVWEKIGGGDLLDWVTLLGPFPQKEWQDGVEDYNEWYREKGMDSDLFLFQRAGPGCSVIQQKTKRILAFGNENFTNPQEYISMLAWYIGVARTQVTEEDNLRPIPPSILGQLHAARAE